MDWRVNTGVNTVSRPPPTYPVGSFGNLPGLFQKIGKGVGVKRRFKVSRPPPTFPMCCGSTKTHRDFFIYLLHGTLPAINHVNAKKQVKFREIQTPNEKCGIMKVGQNESYFNR